MIKMIISDDNDGSDDNNDSDDNNSSNDNNGKHCFLTSHITNSKNQSSHNLHERDNSCPSEDIAHQIFVGNLDS